MKRILSSILLVSALLLSSCGFEGDPMIDDVYTQNVYPGEDGKYDIGSPFLTYGTGYFNELHSGDTYTGNVYLGDYSLERELPDGSGGYWHEYILPATAFSKGASGATQVSPDANTLGGWVLDRDDINEIIFAISHMEVDWDRISDAVTEVWFEVNVDNTLGNVGDTVDLKMIYRYKGVGETANRIQIIEVATVVGQSAQYKLFKVTFPLDWDLGGNVLQNADIVSLGISLETDTSEVDSVIINFAEFKYPTYLASPQR